MKLQDLIRHFRSQVQDEEPPYLWSDEEVLVFAVDAQDMFVRLTKGIPDMTFPADDARVVAGTKLANLEVTEGEPYTAHDPAILRIRSIRLVTAQRNVTPVSEGDLPYLPVRDYGSTFGWGRGLFLDDSDTGDVDYAVLGVIKGSVRWLRVPNAGDTARLHVYRLPYPRPTKQGDSLEIDSQHHLHLVKWMKHLAYSKEDAETYDKDLADKNEALFRSYCAQALGEEQRQRHKTRIVQMSSIWQ